MSSATCMAYQDAGTLCRAPASILLALTTPALAGSVRCTTDEEKALGRWQTLCSDGTRATSYWSPTLQHWQTTITPPPSALGAQRRPHGKDWRR